jgi:hypothetical protein
MQLPGKLALALALMVLSAGTASTSASNPLGKLNVFSGNWSVRVQSWKTPYSNAGSYLGEADCAWQPNRGYMICDYLGLGKDPNTGRVENNLSIFTYSAADKVYKHLGITREIAPLEERVTVNGSEWITPMVIPYKGKKLIYRDVYDFPSPDEQIIQTQISSDNGLHWVLISKGVGTKTR